MDRNINRFWFLVGLLVPWLVYWASAMPGDVTGDRCITARDASLVAQYLEGSLASIDSAGADANQDGRIDSADVAHILRDVAYHSPPVFEFRETYDPDLHYERKDMGGF
tara:strand:+ start:581 stop:907 length:327 start_codon:yes stop_codon:yes gene_type:complete